MEWQFDVLSFYIGIVAGLFGILAGYYLGVFGEHLGWW